MPISEEKTRELKESVRDASNVLRSIGYKHGETEDTTIIAWDIVRSALGRSYSECNDEDIPPAINELKLFIERVKNEKW